NQHEARTRFREKITRGSAEPSLIEAGWASGILQTAKQCTQTGIVRRAQNFLRESMRKRGDLAGGTSEPVIRHRCGQGEAILNNIQAVHVIRSRFHPSTGRERAHRFEIALAPNEKNAVPNKDELHA